MPNQPESLLGWYAITLLVLVRLFVYSVFRIAFPSHEFILCIFCSVWHFSFFVTVSCKSVHNFDLFSSFVYWLSFLNFNVACQGLKQHEKGMIDYWVAHWSFWYTGSFPLNRAVSASLTSRYNQYATSKWLMARKKINCRRYVEIHNLAKKKNNVYSKKKLQQIRILSTHWKETLQRKDTPTSHHVFHCFCSMRFYVCCSRLRACVKAAMLIHVRNTWFAVTTIWCAIWRPSLKQLNRRHNYGKRWVCFCFIKHTSLFSSCVLVFPTFVSICFLIPLSMHVNIDTDIRCKNARLR